ncbi:hypothetical protein H4582DRAFT_2102545 [Lactarius indigo]|nr:hypothetical protein H4582DRAFT_2102545 [Lactarius indigo]
MSASEVPVKVEHLNEISDSVATMVACILQEQLAPILETIREHSKLLDWHSALLNHSTIMNHYNVGKLDDLRDLQTNVNYKLQFHIDPEDRKHPTYRGTPQPTPALRSTVIAARTESPQKENFPPSERPLACSSPSVSSRDRTSSPTGGSTSSVTSAPDSPTRQPTPVSSYPPPPAASPPTPPQISADGSGAPATRRALRRERAHYEIPDPMWNSSRQIDLFEPVLASAVPSPSPPPPPPAAAAGPSAARPSERVAGKKRKRSDDGPLGAAGEALVDPGSECDEPERSKRMKDTTISTERIPIPESFLRVARLNIFGEPSFEERRCEVEQMRYLKNLFRGGAT